MKSLLALLLTLLLPGCIPLDGDYSCNHNKSWADLIAAHEKRYPGLEMADVYKLLHQSTMGSEHAVPSAAEAKAWMEDEVAHLGNGPVEPLIDTLGTSGRFVRVHLRPYLAQGGSPDTLVAAFIKTAQSAAADQNELKCALAAWEGEAEKPGSRWRSDSLKHYLAERVTSGYRAVEHSDAFVAKYAPAYRVIARKLLPIMAPRP